MKYDLTNKSNRFAQRTLSAFSSTLMAILETKAFEQVTVNEVCVACNYPRATFYNYFDDSYDLLNYCWLAMLQEIKIDDYPAMLPEERLYLIFDRLYAYFDSYRDRLTKIMQANPLDGALVTSCNYFVRQQTSKLIAQCAGPGEPAVPQQMMAEFYSNTLQLVIEWSFLRGKTLTKAEAEHDLRYLVGEKK